MESGEEKFRGLKILGTMVPGFSRHGGTGHPYTTREGIWSDGGVIGFVKRAWVARGNGAEVTRVMYSKKSFILAIVSQRPLGRVQG